MKSSISEIALEIAGVLMIALTVFTVISFISYNPADPSINSYLTHAQPVTNKAGIIGASLADTAAQAFGGSAWLLAMGAFYVGIMICFQPGILSLASFSAGLTLLLLAVSAGLGLAVAADPLFAQTPAGGALGAFVAGKTIKWFSIYGSWVIVVTATIMGGLIITRMSFSYFTFRLMGAGIKIKESGISGGSAAWVWLRKLYDRFQEWVFRLPDDVSPEDMEPQVHVFDEEAVAMLAANAAAMEQERDLDEPILEPMIIDPKEMDVESLPEFAPPLPPPSGARKKKPERKEIDFGQEKLKFRDGAADYLFPPLNLLDSTPNTVARQSKEELVKRSLILERKLLDFGIEGRVTQVLPGPVIS
ncbi:MAG: DNA translocase FtsK 4TM domain-containing protein, partial [Nitrospinota bacterium]|nr:DNA translocase FtsK 4TM domain-containing protein [Nitrospinota bacterium]